MRNLSANELADHVLASVGALDADSTLAIKISEFLQATDAGDPRRQRVEQLLGIARDRRDRARS